MIKSPYPSEIFPDHPPNATRYTVLAKTFITRPLKDLHTRRTHAAAAAVAVDSATHHLGC